MKCLEEAIILLEAAVDKDTRWVTIGGEENPHKVLINSKTGKILGGSVPKSLHGTNVSDAKENLNSGNTGSVHAKKSEAPKKKEEHKKSETDLPSDQLMNDLPTMTGMKMMRYGNIQVLVSGNETEIHKNLVNSGWTYDSTYSWENPGEARYTKDGKSIIASRDLNYATRFYYEEPPKKSKQTPAKKKRA